MSARKKAQKKKNRIRILEVLQKNESLTIYDINKKKKIRLSAVHYAINRLKQDRCVAVQEREKTGRRRIFYKITEKGRNELRFYRYRPALIELFINIRRKMSRIIKEVELYYTAKGRMRDFVLANMLGPGMDYSRLHRQLSVLDKKLEKMIKKAEEEKRLMMYGHI